MSTPTNGGLLDQNGTTAKRLAEAEVVPHSCTPCANFDACAADRVEYGHCRKKTGWPEFRAKVPEAPMPTTEGNFAIGWTVQHVDGEYAGLFESAQEASWAMEGWPGSVAVPLAPYQVDAIARGEMEARAVQAEADVKRLRAGILDFVRRNDCAEFRGGMWKAGIEDLRALLNTPTEAGRRG